MGAGDQQTEPAGSALFTWEEVQKHCSRNDQWLVINRKVYCVTEWAKRHPGGFRVIRHYAGEDATEAFTAFHPDKKYVQRFLKPLLIGELAETEPSQDRAKNVAVIQDFRALHAYAEQKGLFRAHSLFFLAHLAHILLMELLAWLLIRLGGTGWIPTALCSILMATAQIQAGWLQHDFGHLSVFKKSSWNHLTQQFLIGHLKHHAKPNVFSKDPDVNMLKIFVVGATQPVEYGTKKIKLLPYNHQHYYFFLVGPPLLIPIYFQLQIMRVMISRCDWVDMVWCFSYYLRYFSCYVPLYGLLGSVALIMFVRFLESHWFVWVTQMNHLPMDIDHEKHQDWLSLQLQATCNIEKSPFNDWFSGHLNFQIEHHLFPTMPRHNYHRVAPLVRALCEKHNISYQVKTMGEGLVDVFSSLKTSGSLWLDAYLHK
ncbi:acyl-CoA Delta-6 desaturase-like isoform X2 [Syngnathus typhle]|uniref:acyl-CoA Delta-6 desaturase-like isoform X2 n=1 Tax=Syngnathus typhle TaxID=161592 RepID=UPI002A6AB70D|nr:acyl-CoA Delta-6 desaturase-like isoform X2 [Syngnathus typhle]XP_061138318.1 acyl-CoA Delta-6 desaturase-like isoform X2 [Syngnathus typhle]